MAVEDFTGYTEVDEGADITVTSTKVDMVAVPKDDTTHVTLDKTAGHFSGDFTHLITMFAASGNTETSQMGMWALSNSLGGLLTIFNASGDEVAVYFLDVSGACRMYNAENDSGTFYSDFSGLSYDTIYYPSIERDEAASTYGDMILKIYDDSGRTSLVDTVTLSMHTSKKDYRYIYACQTWKDASNNAEFTGYSQNLDLQEAAAATWPGWYQSRGGWFCL